MRHKIKGGIGVLALCLILFQIALSVLLAGGSTNPRSAMTIQHFPSQWEQNPPSFEGILGRYRRMNNWDSFHYLSIEEFGYQLSAGGPNYDLIHDYKDNTGFFPGYPLSARLVRSLLSLPDDLALLVSAQLAGVLVWIYFLLFLKRFSIQKKRATQAVLLSLFLPTSMYLVQGYSEPLFLASLLGFIYWYSVPNRKWTHVLLAVLHGYVMTGTRLVGLPLILFPWIYDSPKISKNWKNGFLPLFISAGASLGCLSFFAALQFRFGKWNLYAITQSLGWKSSFNLKAPFVLEYYFPNLCNMSLNAILDRLAVPICTVLFVFLGKRIYESAKEEKPFLVGTLYCAMSLYGAALCATSLKHLQSMSRYCLPSLFLCILLWELTRKTNRNRTAQVLWIFTVLAGLVLQILFLTKHLRGEFVS